MKPRHFVSYPVLAVAVAAAALSLLVAGCGEQRSAEARRVGESAGARATKGQPESRSLTHYTDKTELVLEFRDLVAGSEGTLLAHLTRLVDFKPLPQGRLNVVFSGGNGPEERFVAEAPFIPGIFKLAVTPKIAGERKVALIVESDLGQVTHELGPIVVFADANAAKTDRGEDRQANEGGIAFSKEQQWKVDFATTAAVAGVARSAISATGTVRGHPDSEARLVAPAAGVLRAAGSFPRIGQAVRKGQVLAVLSPRLGGDADQASLEAAAGKAKVALELARGERERMEHLFKAEAVAEKRLLEARANERVAETDALAAAARAQQLGGSGGIALRSPIDGIVADVAATAGAFINEGVPLVHVADTGKLWLEVRVPESEVGRLGTPTGAAFKVDGYEGGFAIDVGRNGRLIAVGGVVDPQTRTVPVVFEFANPERALRLGLTAKVQVFAGGGEDKESVLVPASAIQDENGMSVVYVQLGGERFERRLVRTGPRDGERIAVLAGLDAGERVVSKGAYLLRLSTSTSASAGHAGHSH